MRLSAQGECLSIDGPCDSNRDCDPYSACLAGRCTPGRRFRRVEVLAEGVPVTLGSWRLSDGDSTDSPTLASGGFASRGGAGLALRTSWAIHPRWSLGGYLGYLRAFDGTIDLDKPNKLGLESRELTLRLVRLGSLVSYRWPVSRALAAGVGLELGLIFGTTGGGDLPLGPEMGPDFFFEVPLGSGATRTFLMLSLGFRAGALDHGVDLPNHPSVDEWWYYFMPVVRLALGFGR